MNRSRRIIGLIAGLVLVGTAGWTFSANAEAPNKLTQQGRLLDSNDDPVSGDIEFTFRIYDADVDGTELWTQTQTLTLDGGYYSAVLGADSGDGVFPENLFDGSVRYLSVQIGSDAELAPRQALTSVPYAIAAQVASDVTGDINPSSINVTTGGISVGGNEVIDSTGKWVGTAPTPNFGALLSIVQATSLGTEATESIQASCGGKFATGGSCQIIGDLTKSAVKVNQPLSALAGWRCDCIADDTNTGTCQVEARVVCAGE